MADLEYTLYGPAPSQQGDTLAMTDGVEIVTDKVAITAASVQCATPFPANSAIIVITPEADCRVAFGADPTASKTAPKTRLLQTGKGEYYFRVQAGWKIAVIAAS